MRPVASVQTLPRHESEPILVVDQRTLGFGVRVRRVRRIECKTPSLS